VKEGRKGKPPYITDEPSSLQFPPRHCRLEFRQKAYLSPILGTVWACGNKSLSCRLVQNASLWAGTLEYLGPAHRLRGEGFPLFSRLSRRQREEFETQALAHLEALLRSAYRMCDSPEAAEDAVQETYLQAWKYWRSFQQGTNCRAWLFRILLNVIKKKALEKRILVPIDEPEVENVIRFEPLDRVNEFEVLEVFDQLTAEHREVMLLVVVEEMSYKDAATALGVPMGTVMSRLSRARMQLRQRLRRANRKPLVKNSK
jgi:RNA polymerase sigma-70 factor, ECF subfamily